MLDYNFFSGYIAAGREMRRKTLVVVSIFTVLVAIIGGGYLFTEWMVYSLQRDIQPMQAFLNSAETRQKIQEVEKKKKKFEVMNKYYNAVNRISSNIDRSDRVKSSLLEKVTETLPADTTFKTLSLTPESILIQGTVSNRVAVAEFSHNLAALGIFMDVYVKDIKQDSKDGNICTFDIECMLKDVAEK